MEIRDYRAGDEEKIMELFGLAFKKPLARDVWNWRFRDNIEGMTMIKLMWDGEILAGHYAVSPVRMQVSGQPVLTALSMTTMTHPEYGGRGIFGELAEALYADAHKNNGLQAVWGYPNNNSHYGFIKNLKWKNLENLPTMTLDAARIKETTTDRIVVADDFTQKHEIAFNETTSEFPVKVIRSAAYLHWRFTANPINDYVIFSAPGNNGDYFAVAKLFRSFSVKDAYEIDLAELCFPADGGLLNELLYKVVTHFSEFKVCRINCWLPLNDPKHILLEKAGFTNSTPITYSGIRILEKGLGQMETANSWYYSMSDSDVY